MKISISQKRESFDRIFETTISRFLSDINKIATTAKWRTKKNGSGYRNQTWYCNPLINSIVVKNANKEVYKSFINEYKTNPLTPWKSIIQRMYLLFAANSWLAHYFSPYIIEINPAIESSKNKIFIGGNTKIRLIDIEKQIVYAILKDGYDNCYVKNDLEVRTNYPYLPAPKIYNISGKYDWYCEEYIWGVSPDRINSKIGGKYIENAIFSLHKMYCDTMQIISRDVYIKSLIHSINNNLDHCHNIPSNVIGVINRCVKQLSMKLTNQLPLEISLCQNHGDLQLGNILCNDNENKLWIVDWEFTRVRQYGFDYFVMILLGRSKGLLPRLIKFYNNDLDENQKKRTRLWRKLDVNNIRYMLLLYLLEELEFRVEEQRFVSNLHEISGILTFIEVINGLNKHIDEDNE
jgi:thiamine kinase-like enzyme